MTRARLLCAGAAALVAAVGLAPAVATGATTASAAKTICVPLVVDARSIGGSVDTECTTVKKGATGIDVLEAGGHSVTFRKDGLLCTIDGLPKSGCANVDNTHYWAYYHREPNASSWSYSNEGASTYQPENYETEGWVYDDGADTIPQPDNIPRATICAGKATPSPKATPTSSRQTPTPLATRSVATTPTPIKRTHHRHQVAPTGSPAVTPATPTATSSRAVTLPSTGATGHGNATGAIIAAAVIAVIAGVTAVTVRRRRP